MVEEGDGEGPIVDNATSRSSHFSLRGLLGIEKAHKGRRKAFWAACRQRLWWRARLRSAEGEARRLRQRLSHLEKGSTTTLSADGTQHAQDASGQQTEFARLEQQLNAKDWLLTQLQEQLHESEEHFARMLQDEHSRLESCESQFLAAMREAEAQLAHAALAEEHLLNELRLAQKEIDEVQLENEFLRNGIPQAKAHASAQDPQDLSEIQG